ncbi:MAG: DUF4399 domain-containing protein [Porticoccaceae bacterium]|nr:DUF4399 domain-containing protein [Porticoccaceae bacterium]MDG1308312.1 DUF4399 domain-containing protein [Porticoccaceae bacterium]
MHKISFLIAPKLVRRALLLSFISTICAPAIAQMTELSSDVAADARVWIESPGDGQVVSSPVAIVFGSDNVSISSAGVEQVNSGHHHLLIDMEELPVMDMPLPAHAQLIHFGKGQTSAKLSLEPGEHSLQLLLGNYIHVPHTRPVMSEKITIVVK